jgi:hypothetical protein
VHCFSLPTYSFQYHDISDGVSLCMAQKPWALIGCWLQCAQPPACTLLVYIVTNNKVKGAKKEH